VKAVAVKSQGQQVILAMHRIRQGLMKMHTATINALHGQ
jgi:transposase